MPNFNTCGAHFAVGKIIYWAILGNGQVELNAHPVNLLFTSLNCQALVKWWSTLCTLCCMEHLNYKHMKRGVHNASNYCYIDMILPSALVTTSRMHEIMLAKKTPTSPGLYLISHQQEVLRSQRCSKTLYKFPANFTSTHFWKCQISIPP